MYYLYKLSSKTTKHYYIGVTCDRYQREKSHYAVISDLVYKRSGVRCNPIHKLIAEQIVASGGSIGDHCVFEIIGTARTAKSISQKENRAIRKSDEWCTNQLKKSTYQHKPNPAVEYLKKMLAARKKAMRRQWEKENAEMYKKTPKICQ